MRQASCVHQDLLHLPFPDVDECWVFYLCKEGLSLTTPLAPVSYYLLPRTALMD